MAEARRIASNSAWAVGSPEASRSLAATARTSPPLAITAPTGTSPFSAASSAASKARRIIARSVSENRCAAVSTTKPMITVRGRRSSRRRSRPGSVRGVDQFVLDPRLYLVSHLSERRGASLSLRARWVGEGPVQALPCSGEDRTGFICLVADGYDEVEGFSEVTLQRLGLLGRDVYSDLRRDGDRLPPDTRRPGTRA